MLNSGFGFWFLCAWFPFLLGVLIVTLGAISKTSRWIYVNVEQKPGESPHRIVFAFPDSLGIAALGHTKFRAQYPA